MTPCLEAIPMKKGAIVEWNTQAYHKKKLLKRLQTNQEVHLIFDVKHNVHTKLDSLLMDTS